MQELTQSSHAPAKTRTDAQALVQWFNGNARPFLEKNAPEILPPLDNDVKRISRILAIPEQITVCFLGHSGVGKSTLLNALAAGADPVLPAGGRGPLTALATEVLYSQTPYFRVSYHKRARLWQVIFALEKGHHATGGAQGGTTADIPPSELDEEERKDLEAEVGADSSEETDSKPSGHVYREQAQQIVTGDQFKERPIPYLIEALRFAYGYESKIELAADDLARVERVRTALALSEKGVPYERAGGHDAQFTVELKEHAAGFLAPIIEKIEVGWPSRLLEHGIALVDLPGVGIARDAYRDITRKYIRGSARAVILTVDRSGLTSETIELLRSSGYWDRLIGAIDDPASDPCALFIAVTKVDDVASEDWRNLPASDKKPKRRETYAQVVREMKERMKLQAAAQLASIGDANNSDLQSARSKARDIILESLQVHPISAPEFRKLLRNDEDDPPFLQSEIDSGIPDLRNSLQRLAAEERQIIEHDIAQVTSRLKESISGELRRLSSMWSSRERDKKVEEGLKRELDNFLSDKRKERDVRLGAFREFLESTSQTKIKQLVGEAREIAEGQVSHYLRGMQDAHWATLKAAVTRGGAFVGSRAINMPDDVATRFQEPMASVWSTKLLVDVRKRTGEFATDQTKLVENLCDWARSNIQSNSQSELIEQQRKRIARHADQMRQVGKEAVGDLRQTVKLKISDAIRKPIRTACKAFVEKGNHIGPGVKRRILDLFNDLAKESTRAAQQPATRILETNFNTVRSDIKKVFDDWSDPLEDTADLILERNLDEIEKRTGADRETVLAAISALLAEETISSGEEGQSGRG